MLIRFIARSFGVALLFLLFTTTTGAPLPGVAFAQPQTYIGSEACGECHPDQYETFSAYAKKAHSDKSVRIMLSDLTAAEARECYACHTTGYGEPGGFVSFEATPHLAHAGCEVCHGPGSEHADTGGDPTLITRELSLDDCRSCHNDERVANFNYKPLLYGGAH
jgi:hypothetical protein